ncbi:MAG: MtrB/PioB family outer membrane beta-barrel protein, partial [Acidimicrobiia bacterium]|nr:MtrB/PioB family outer membrane beta-barrel protein [Acidimicrobiia bacterium]
LGGLAGLSWNLQYAQENRTGLRPYGGSFGFGNVVEIAETIDYRTSSAEIRGEWNTKSAGVQFGYRHSIFENDISTMYWDNPFRITDGTDGRAYLAPGGASINGAATGFADLYPDNEADHLFVNGRGRIGGWWAQGSLVVGSMSQDDPLLPYTLNTAIDGVDFDGSEFDATDPANLPVRNADLDVDTLTFNGDAGTTFADRFHLAFKLRYYDYDNGSPRIEFPGYVRYHGVWEEIPRVTVPYSYTRDTAGVSFEWEVTGDHDLELYYDRNAWDREFRETEKTEEDVVGLRWDGRFGSDLTVRAGYETGDRTIEGEYLTEAQEFSFLDPAGINNQPGLRKFLQAEREYDEVDARVQWYPSDTMDFAFFVVGRDEDYPGSQ